MLPERSVGSGDADDAPTGEGIGVSLRTSESVKVHSRTLAHATLRRLGTSTAPPGLAAVRRPLDAAVPRTVDAQPLGSALLAQFRVHATAELSAVASSANVLRPQDGDAPGRGDVEGAGNTGGSISARHDLRRRSTVRRPHRRRVPRRPAKAANEELHSCDCRGPSQSQRVALIKKGAIRSIAAALIPDDCATARRVERA
jgi:hypothetical protein